MRKLILVLPIFFFGLTFLVPPRAQAACKEGEWSFEMETKGESWLGDYGACSGGRYRCHSVCWDRWTTQCVGGVWVRKWVASSGCSKDHVCRVQIGWSGRHCDCCTPPSHNVCQDKACVRVFTGGTDECSPIADPSPDCVHNECQDMQCVFDVAGPGPDLCTRDMHCYHRVCRDYACVKLPDDGLPDISDSCAKTEDCLAPQHKECRNMQCVNVDGAGENKCTDNAHCFHKECQNEACVKVPDSGFPEVLDSCAKTEDCLAPQHKECRNMQCVNVDGAGENKCTVNDDCHAPPLCACYQIDVGCCTGCPETQKQVEWFCPLGEPSCPPPPDFSSCVEAGCQCRLPAWFQTARGDVAATGGLVVNIPTASDAAPFSPAFNRDGYKGPYFSVGQPVGAVFVGNNLVSLGSGIVSGDRARQWLAREYPFSSKLRDYNFSFFQTNWKHMTASGGTLADGKIGSLSLASLAPGWAVLVEGSLTVENGNGLNGVEAMVLVRDQLSFAGDFAPSDSAIFFVNQGTVSFGPVVRSVRAAILTDSQIGVGEVGPDEGLLLEGMYLANNDNGNFVFLRQRGNNKAPAVMFAYAPEIIVELTKSFGKARVTSWREVIGGKTNK